MEKAREEAGIEHQRALQQIESATSAALKELAERSATLAVDLAGKIVGARFKAADHSRLIDQAVTEFTRSGQTKVNGKSKGSVFVERASQPVRIDRRHGIGRMKASHGRIG